jgi:hypothetical protein
LSDAELLSITEHLDVDIDTLFAEIFIRRYQGNILCFSIMYLFMLQMRYLSRPDQCAVEGHGFLLAG